MNDFELNKAIAEAVYPNTRVDRYSSKQKTAFIFNGDGTPPNKFNFNNWNDLMHLVVEHNISLECQITGDKEVYWEANGLHQYCDEVHKNPQRALAEYLLKVLTSKAFTEEKKK